MKIGAVTLKNIKSFIAEFNLEFPSGLTIVCSLFTGKNGYFITMPSSKFTGKDGTEKYKNLVTWADKEQHTRFSKWAIAELEKACPAAFGSASSNSSPRDDYDDSDLPF